MREHGASFDNTVDGPTKDHTGNGETYFAYVSARNSPGEGAVTEIELPTILAANHEIQCFHFWFAIKVAKKRACHSKVCLEAKWLSNHES